MTAVLRTGQFCTTAAAAPSTPGSYVLVVDLPVGLAVTIAGKYAGTLLPGRYLYCGSAKGPGGLRARLARHMRRDKALRWHVDQLTTAGAVRGAWVFPGGDECHLARCLSQLPAPIAGFGSSDCSRCRSHLAEWTDNGTLLFAALGGPQSRSEP